MGLAWRVMDADSQGIFCPRKGVLAGNTKTKVNLFARKGYGRKVLKDELGRHLVWANRVKSSLISAYFNYDAALREARRRIKVGKKDVIIICIDLDEVTRRSGIQFRAVGKLAGKIRLRIPREAQHNSIYEIVFLNRIPMSVIKDVFEL